MAEFNSKDDSLVKKVDNFMDVVLINLSEISEKLEKNEEIYILGKKVEDTGKNWLKLLSLRHWGKKLENNLFEIPEFKLNKEINSAIAYLKKYLMISYLYIMPGKIFISKNLMMP